MTRLAASSLHSQYIRPRCAALAVWSPLSAHLVQQSRKRPFCPKPASQVLREKNSGCPTWSGKPQ
eukprot:5057033-Lingulodinium_polyedra.AAC.1